MSLTTIFIGLIVIGVLMLTAFSGTSLLRCPKCKKIGSLRKLKDGAEVPLPQSGETLDEELARDKMPEQAPDYICKDCGNAIRLPR